MRATDIIRIKRDGGTLTREQVEFVIRGVTDGSLPDYQASALLMAVVLRGMTGEETAWLTDAMVRSGIVVDLSGIPGSKVDKHSTGGVGDKTSLVLAPLAAACGVKVPMMSGRGLGHTGGTLDKLESIPGFRIDLSLDELRAALDATGCAMLGQTRQIAPADKTLYALRDVTATVESVPLITASIMSKKIAEGIDGLVLDVKTGRGAFMKTLDDSRRLARSLVDTGNRSGVRTQALITRMDAPLGRAVGNALEVVECVETLKGRGPADVTALSVQLAARMVRLAGVAGDAGEAGRLVRRALESGAGLEKWREIVAHQGGDPRTVDDYRLLPSAPARHLVRAPRGGFLWELDAERLGRASVALGAGRSRVEDAVDPGVGIVAHAAPGDPLREGEPVLEVHYRDDAGLAAALALLEGAVAMGDEPPAVPPLVVEEIA
ncbi:MAG: pdp [Acidobacteria bacterium]|nr:pdp [Acidobacteriota bacterium]